MIFMFGSKFFNESFNPYFIGLPILIWAISLGPVNKGDCFNPYFIGLPILMGECIGQILRRRTQFQSLFYWITYSYGGIYYGKTKNEKVSILILLDYLFLLS